MKKMFKHTIAMTFVLAMICSLAVIHAAEPADGIMPLYTYIDDARCSIAIVNSRAIMNAYVYGDFEEAQIKMILQKQVGSSWEDVTSWTVREETDTLVLDKSYTIDTTENYRVKANFKIWRGTATETASKTATP